MSLNKRMKKMSKHKSNCSVRVFTSKSLEWALYPLCLTLTLLLSPVDADWPQRSASPWSNLQKIPAVVVIFSVAGYKRPRFMSGHQWSNLLTSVKATSLLFFVLKKHLPLLRLDQPPWPFKEHPLPPESSGTWRLLASRHSHPLGCMLYNYSIIGKEQFT